jgi:uncharacterized protein YdhG (YjbR/CyaY superfamily)
MKTTSQDIAVRSIDDYLALQTPTVQEALEHLRQQIRLVIPEAQEVISYQIPMFKYHGSLVGFGAAKKHCSFYVCDNATVQAFQAELQSYSTSAGTIRFSPAAPLPDDLIWRIVEARVKANLAKARL